jgi:serine/threonine protein kinase
LAASDYGRYTLLKKLASGGMAEVYLAKQKGLEGFEKLLVIKRILPHLADNAEFVEMFLNEARIAARFNHPNIAQIYDLGREDDTYFIAMEYIHGEDLGQVMRNGWSKGLWLPLPMSLRLIAAVCEGLYYAHTKTDDHGKPLMVVHRDVSPQNVIVSFDGNIKVVDFGIARATNQSSNTRAGMIKGKYAYMSPEQATGKALDQRSDLFATGLILYELVTGVRPFKRDSDMLTLKAAVDCHIEPPSRVADVPAALDPIVMRAVERLADDRYADARVFQLAIEGFLLEQKWSASTVHVSDYMKKLFADRSRGEPPPDRVAPTGKESSPEAHAGPSETKEPVAKTRSGRSFPRLDSDEWNRVLNVKAGDRKAAEATAPGAVARPTGEADDAEWERTLAVATNQAAAQALASKAGRLSPPSRPGVSTPPGASSPKQERIESSRMEVRPPKAKQTLQPEVRSPSEETRADPVRAEGGKKVSRTSGESKRPRSLLYADEDALRVEREKVRADELARPALPRAEEKAPRSKAETSIDADLRAARRKVSWGIRVVIALIAVAALHPATRQALHGLGRELARPSDGVDKVVRPVGDTVESATLSLESNVDVQVLLDGSPLGRTPLSGKPVPAGTLALVLRNANLGIERKVTLSVKAGEDVRHRERFVRVRLRFLSDRECEVFLLGRRVAKAPGPPFACFEGTYDFECRNEGLALIARKRVSVEARPGTTLDVVFRLAPM